MAHTYKRHTCYKHCKYTKTQKIYTKLDTNLNLNYVSTLKNAEDFVCYVHVHVYLLLRFQRKKSAALYISALQIAGSHYFIMNKHKKRMPHCSKSIFQHHSFRKLAVIKKTQASNKKVLQKSEGCRDDSCKQSMETRGDIILLQHHAPSYITIPT